MAKQVQFRRGSTEEHQDFTGAEGEITINTSDFSLRVHDGLTAGGHTVSGDLDLTGYATEAYVNNAISSGSGTVNVSGLVSFPSTIELKSATLSAGDVVKTKGYYVAGDEGAAEYIVKSGVTADGWGSHDLGNGLVAVLTPVTGYYRASQWGGAQGDVTKDTPAVQAMIDAGENGVYLDPGVHHELLGLIVTTPKRFELTGAGPLKSIIQVRGKVITYNPGALDPNDHLGNITKNVGFYVVADCTDGIVKLQSCRDFSFKHTEIIVGNDGESPNVNGSNAAQWIGHFANLDNSYECSFRDMLGRWHGGALFEIGDSIGYHGVVDTIILDTVVWTGNYAIFTRSGMAELHNIQFNNVKFRDSVNSAENPYGEWAGATPRPANWDNAEHGETYITQAISAGGTTLVVNDASQLNLGNLTTDNLLYIGYGERAEQVRIASVNGNTITLATPVRFNHEITVGNSALGEPVIFAPVFVTMQSVADVHINQIHLERAWIGFNLEGVKGLRCYGGNMGAKYVFRVRGKCRDWTIGSVTHPGIHYIDSYLCHVPAYHELSDPNYNDLESIVITAKMHKSSTSETMNRHYVGIDNLTRDAKVAFSYKGNADVEVPVYENTTVFPEQVRNAFIYMYRDTNLIIGDGKVNGQLVTLTFNQNYQGGFSILSMSDNITLYHAFTLQSAARAYDTITLRWNAVNNTWYEQHRTSTPGI